MHCYISGVGVTALSILRASNLVWQLKAVVCASERDFKYSRSNKGLDSPVIWQEIPSDNRCNSPAYKKHQIFCCLIVQFCQEHAFCSAFTVDGSKVMQEKSAWAGITKLNGCVENLQMVSGFKCKPLIYSGSSTYLIHLQHGLVGFCHCWQRAGQVFLSILFGSAWVC